MLNSRDIEKAIRNGGFYAVEVNEIRRIGWVGENVIAADVACVVAEVDEVPEWGTVYITLNNQNYRTLNTLTADMTADFAGAGLDGWKPVYFPLYAA